MDHENGINGFDEYQCAKLRQIYQCANLTLHSAEEDTRICNGAAGSMSAKGQRY
jgi:hypothetical protein